MLSSDQIKRQIVDACHALDKRQFVANHDGNISVRVEANRFFITPTSFAKRSVTENDVLLVDFEGSVVEGKHRVFSEWRLHQTIYEILPEVGAVVHAHPPYTMAWGLAGKQYGFGSIPESIVSLGGPLKTVDFLSPLSSRGEIKAAFMGAIQNCYAVLIPGNGVLAFGDDVEMALLRVELVEQIIRAHSLALQLGSVQSLDRSLVKDLASKRPLLKPKWQKVEAAAVTSDLVPKSAAPSAATSESTKADPNQVRDIIRSELQKILNR
jgi:L-fuculose-phosphate aldolase